MLITAIELSSSASAFNHKQTLMTAALVELGMINVLINLIIDKDQVLEDSTNFFLYDLLINVF